VRQAWEQAQAQAQAQAWALKPRCPMNRHSSQYPPNKQARFPRAYLSLSTKVSVVCKKTLSGPRAPFDRQETRLLATLRLEIYPHIGGNQQISPLATAIQIEVTD